ncbi:MAG: response regulator [Thermodesulfobacteriota bacterium]|nr:response regulator [Thermodesulfobacteriota bacterium]
MDKTFNTIRILVVDDEKNIRDGSERILSRLGFQVLKASRGLDALDILSKEKIAIVFLDLKMPGMDGMEVLERIIQMDKSIIVIVVTGFATVETAIDAMKKGAYDFIPKPFEPDQMRITAKRAADRVLLSRETEKLEMEKRRTLFDLDTEKSRLHTIVESLPNGVLVTNTDGVVVLMNPAFRHYLGENISSEPGSVIENYVPDADLCRLIREISTGKHIDYEDIPDQELKISEERYLLVRGQPVLGEKRECLGAVVNFVDISDMKVLDRLKSEFVAKVSHELRSPLSTIHEQLALVIKDMVGEMAAHDHHVLSRAKDKTQGLISLIGDLLDLSRIEEGLICHEPQPVRLEEILKNIVDFLGTKATNKNQSLTMELPENPLPKLSADPIAIESIFGNLITNAINYTQEGGNIRVIIDQAGINTRVKVVDNGFGIADKYMDKIFERFYRVKDDRTRYITGTGLGLPIVKGLVESLGGFIDVESNPGEGSTFTVLLPIEVEKQ